MANNQYEILVAPLPDEEGGGFIAVVPDLNGCLSDGDTPQEALENALDAIEQWLSAQKAMGRKAPKPGCGRAAAEKRDREICEALENAQKTIDEQMQVIRDLHAQVRELEECGPNFLRIAGGPAWPLPPSPRRTAATPRPKLVTSN